MKTEAATQIPGEDQHADRSMPVENPQEEQSMHSEAPNALVHGVIRKGTGDAGGPGVLWVMTSRTVGCPGARQGRERKKPEVGEGNFG